MFEYVCKVAHKLVKCCKVVEEFCMLVEIHICLYSVGQFRKVLYVL